MASDNTGFAQKIDMDILYIHGPSLIGQLSENYGGGWGGGALTVIIITTVRLRLFNPAPLLLVHHLLLAVRRRLLSLGFTVKKKTKPHSSCQHHKMSWQSTLLATSLQKDENWENVSRRNLELYIYIRGETVRVFVLNRTVQGPRCTDWRHCKENNSWIL